jgi:hypothetical protein
MVPVLITRDELITRQASDAISALTRLVEAGSYDPPPVLRDVVAGLAAAVARADRRRPEPPLDSAAGVS